eukprot:CAMPEP_0206059870 /NCGR_PEP_ID=MMETSP1466-20131121/49995_1 /ASSEMBLY_ACC=CAM_ASM_001126 /TAXON_ID=44452 /ORGANISM="Pavlova gyrans, Strain CCMP608" /LENGTH=48 /DNA_ID= /DNA_START= /DNA_END= /DNA_ORIENTATION=
MPGTCRPAGSPTASVQYLGAENMAVLNRPQTHASVAARALSWRTRQSI